MEFHGKFNGIPWNSIEFFHGIPWKNIMKKNRHMFMKNFMEFHGKFHGIQFHEIFHENPWNSMEFHGKFHELTERFSPG
jgi:hypothetical protein